MISVRMGLKAASIIAAAIAGVAGSAQAGVITWTGGTSTDFATAANWNGNAAPVSDLTTDIGQFAGTVTANQPVVGAARSINGINFGSSGWTLSGGANALTIGANGVDAMSVTSGTNTIQANVILGNNQSWNIGGGTLTASGVISGSNT